MLLALETANEGCSVSLFDGQQIIAHRQDDRSREQTRLILPMIDAILKEHHVPVQTLEGIAFSRGPGSFSGVRINAAVTQGLAWAHDLPVIPVSSLQALAQAAYRLKQATRVIAVIDARMNEIYSAVYQLDDHNLMQPVTDEQLTGYNDVDCLALTGNKPVLLAGNGANLVLIADDMQAILEQDISIMPNSQDIAVLGYAQLRQGQAVTAAQALPVYLRDNAWKKIAEQGSPK